MLNFCVCLSQFLVAVDLPQEVGEIQVSEMEKSHGNFAGQLQGGHWPCAPHCPRDGMQTLWPLQRVQCFTELRCLQRPVCCVFNPKFHSASSLMPNSPSSGLPVHSMPWAGAFSLLLSLTAQKGLNQSSHWLFLAKSNTIIRAVISVIINTELQELTIRDDN